MKNNTEQKMWVISDYIDLINQNNKRSKVINILSEKYEMATKEIKYILSIQDL